MNVKSNSQALSPTQDSKSKSFDLHPNTLSSLDLLESESARKLDRPTLEQKKTIAQIYIEQAKVYENEENWHKAILACKNALELNLDNADAYKILGNILYRQGKEGEALGVYAKALTIDPNSASIYANLGTLYADREDWQKALDYYQQAIILDPKLAGTYRNLAQVWEELGETEKALECLCQAIDLQPDLLPAEDYFRFGTELYQQGKTKEASLLFIRGLQLEPHAERELSQLVQMFEELEEWQQAVFYYHQLISLPDSPDDFHPRSHHHRKKPIRQLLSDSKAKASNQKKIPKKIEQNITLPRNIAQKLLPQLQSSRKNSQQPDSAFAWNDLGSAYAQKQQWHQAISCYEEALQLDPEFAKGYRNLARVYQKQGESLKAALYWCEAFAIEPNKVTADEHLSLAEKLLEYQQQDKAVVCLERAIELKPDFEPAHLLLAQLRSS